MCCVPSEVWGLVSGMTITFTSYSSSQNLLIGVWLSWKTRHMNLWHTRSEWEKCLQPSSTVYPNYQRHKTAKFHNFICWQFHNLSKGNLSPHSSSTIHSSNSENLNKHDIHHKEAIKQAKDFVWIEHSIRKISQIRPAKVPSSTCSFQVWTCENRGISYSRTSLQISPAASPEILTSQSMKNLAFHT